MSGVWAVAGDLIGNRGAASRASPLRGVQTAVYFLSIARGMVPGHL